MRKIWEHLYCRRVATTAAAGATIASAASATITATTDAQTVAILHRSLFALPTCDHVWQIALARNACGDRQSVSGRGFCAEVKPS